MNERIKELAVDSGAMFDHMTWVERDLAPVFNRFAELLVQECANIAYEVGLHRQTKHEILRRFGLEVTYEN